MRKSYIEAILPAKLGKHLCSSNIPSPNDVSYVLERLPSASNNDLFLISSSTLVSLQYVKREAGSR